MEQLSETIFDYMSNYIQIYKQCNSTLTSWGQPIITFADAYDPLFLELKNNNQNHLLPTDLLLNAKTVIAYFIPFEKSIVQSNITQGLSSHEWAKAYIETNQLIINMSEALVNNLNALGYQSATIAPTHNFDEVELVSKWSHKHIGYIAGLGTFGLHQMLITKKGCCGRIGSIVTDALIKANVRPDKEYCKYKYNQKCKACTKLCPSGALTENLFDRHLCYEICLKNAEHHKDEGLADVCGKCISMVPCSFCIP